MEDRRIRGLRGSVCVYPRRLLGFHDRIRVEFPTIARFRDNPDFPADPQTIRADWERMRASPCALQRPVVVLAGWRAPPLRVGGLEALLSSVTSQRPSDFLSIAYAGLGTIGEAVRRSMSRIDERWPGSAGLTPEVDVIGISMGGLVARRAAAAPPDGLPRLHIARLFTLATPHRGAKLARYIALDRAALDMRPGSELLQELDRSLEEAEYELLCYAQLRDWWVGATRAAPPGRLPFWTDTRTPAQHVLSHFLINSNPAVLRDIARRLRGEEPVARRGSLPPSD